VLWAVIVAAYVWALGAMPQPQARSLAFTALMAGDLALCWTLLDPAPFWKSERWLNRWYWAVSAGVMALLELLRHLSFTAGVLEMPPLNLRGWGLALILGWGATLWFEVPKILRTNK